MNSHHAGFRHKAEEIFNSLPPFAINRAQVDLTQRPAFSDSSLDYDVLTPLSVADHTAIQSWAHQIIPLFAQLRTP